jgi:hypothetical protein
MSRDNQKHSSSTSRSKSPFKLALNAVSTEEIILNLRKHTVPIPFALKSSHRECREEISKKLPRFIKKECSPHSQKSFSRLINFSPLRNVGKSATPASSFKKRDYTPSPFRITQVPGKNIDEKSRIKKQNQWKKIIATVKLNFDDALQVANHEKRKNKSRFTIEKIRKVDENLRISIP